jgi:cell wall-associated NlpC family hydrolase
MKRSEFVGIKWKDRGRDFGGVDCFGLLLLYYKHIRGVVLPDYEYDTTWCKCGDTFFLEEYQKLWKKTSKPATDDVLIFYGVDGMMHTGICIGSGKFLQSVRKAGVVISRINTWKPRFYGAFEYVG